MGRILRIHIDNQELVELAKDDSSRLIVLDTNKGYELMLKYRDTLLEKFNFELLSEYGLTDMVNVFSYKNNHYTLCYDCDGGMVTLETLSRTEEELNEYRRIAAFLQNMHSSHEHSCFVPEDCCPQ